MSLKKTLTLVVFFSITTTVILFLIVPKPRVNKDFTDVMNIWDSKQVFKLYELKRTNVYLNRGDIYKLERSNPILANASIAITTKFDSGEPFHPNSANSRLICKVSDKNQLIKDFERLAQKHNKRIWADRLPNTYKELDNIPIYLAAGIPAGPTSKDKKETDRTVKYKPQKVLDVTKELCSKTKKDGIESLAMTYFGTGAARIDEDRAITSILNGINHSAANREAPKNIIIVLYPKGDTDALKNVWLDEQVELFHQAINSKNGLQIWNYRSKSFLIIQIVLLIIAPCLAGLIALNMKGLKDRFWWGPLGAMIIKWSLLMSGFFALNQSNFLNLKPLPWTNLGILFVIAIVAPLWEWNKMSEIREKEKQNTTNDKLNEQTEP